LETYTNRSYQLSNPVAAPKASLSNRFNSSATTMSNVSSCNSNLQGCSQITSFYFENCDAMQGNFIATFTPICSAGESINCAHPNGNVNVVISLNAARACSEVDTVQFQEKTLKVYSTPSLSSTASTFTASGIAYFGAVITTTDANIYNRTLKSVCMILNPSSGNLNCIAVDFALTPRASGSNDPKFSINLAQTRALTNETTAQSFRVVAIIGIVGSYAKQVDIATTTDLVILQNNETSSMNSSESASSALSTSSTTESNEETNEESASDQTMSTSSAPTVETPEKDDGIVSETHDHEKLKISLIAALSGVCALVIVVVVLTVFIAYKKRQGERAAEASFNFSDVS